MESNDELKEIDIKNRACFYFDDIIRIENIDFDNVLSDKKSYEKNLHIFIRNIYGCKTIAYYAR